MDEIKERVQRIISKFNGFPIKGGEAQIALRELGLSILEIVSIAFEIEEAFNICFEDSELDQFFTFCHSIGFLKQRVGAPERLTLRIGS